MYTNTCALLKTNYFKYDDNMTTSVKLKGSWMERWSENNFIVFHSRTAILHHCLGHEVIICEDI